MSTTTEERVLPRRSAPKVREVPELDGVARAALALDELVPGWAPRIDLRALNLKDGDLCVLGQLYDGDWEYGYGLVQGYLGGEEWEDAAGNGVFHQNAYLGRWHDEIAARRPSRRASLLRRRRS